MLLLARKRAVKLPDSTGLEAREMDRDCKDVRPEAVLNRVRDIQGDRPFVISAVVYNDVTKVPTRGKNNGITQEEYGYGYMELVTLAGGASVDISGRHYEDGLDRIGRLVNIKMNPDTQFVLEHTGAEPNSIQVKVNASSVPHTYSESLNRVEIAKTDAGGALAAVDIRYCLKAPGPSPTPTPSGGPIGT
jgi:hypothetical protein